jgi:ESS family glutamate:Na+ symporter
MDFSAANVVLWNVVVQFGIIAATILAANALRRNFKPIRNTLMPTAVLGGFLLLVLRSVGILNLELELLEMITYHGIALGFIAMTLRVPEFTAMEEKGSWIGIRSGSLIVSTYLIQGIMGLIITIALGYSFIPNLFKAAGILLPMGYGQGPGQANNVGTIYENLGMAGGRSFALALAASGFLWACIAGVIYLNVLKRKRVIRGNGHEEISGSVTIDMFEHKGEIPVSESVDRLSVQVALVLLVYLGTYLATWGLTSGINEISPGLGETINSLLWGFNFIVGSLLAMLLRLILRNLKNRSIMTRQYQNNYLLSRISGLAFDVMIVAGIASIEIGDLSGNWLVFILMGLAGGIGTFFYMKRVTQILYPDYYYEGFVSMFGMMTGTVSSGILLLREIDPALKTPAANNMVTGSCSAIVFALPMLILIGMAPKSTFLLFAVFVILILYFIGLLLLTLKLGAKKG